MSSAGALGVRIGVAGAASLLGQEILRVIKDRGLPIASQVAFEVEAEEPDLPVLDLSEGAGITHAEEGSAGPLDLLFLAARPRSKTAKETLLGRALEAAGVRPGELPSSCLVIDAVGALDDAPGALLNVPRLEKEVASGPRPALSGIRISPHPATIVLDTVLLKLADFHVTNSTAHVFLPASQSGPRAIEELQKQTVNLLSFQKTPQKVFGAQLAFNMLSRLPGKHAAELNDLEARVRRELRECLNKRAPMPALRFFQVAVFYSLALSIFVELEKSVRLDAIGAALAGANTSVRKHSDSAPTQVEAAGSGEILVDAITEDPDHPGGYWIWATVDDVRLAADNAVDIAEISLPRHFSKQ